MNVLETVLNRRWILKSRDKELYYQVRDGMEGVKKFLTEKLGYPVIVNPLMVKVEKMPAKAEPWMGIREFTHPIQYAFLCVILMFLEDREAEEQFVLSELTEYIQGRYKEEQVDWTSYTYRRHLVKVMKFCVECGMLKIDDGSGEGFARNEASEVLYENTGASRYFMKNFTRNIMDYTRTEDFEEDEWIDRNADRGIIRRQRVYRKLLMSPGMYREENGDEDFAYVRNYRNIIGGELSELFDCELQVYRTSAFLVMGENGNLGRRFPEEKTVSDIVLLLNRLLLEKIKTKEINVPLDEKIVFSGERFRRLTEECRERYGEGFVKSYRDMTSEELYREILEYMEETGLMERRDGNILIRAAAGKLAGGYPEDYQSGERTEDREAGGNLHV